MGWGNQGPSAQERTACHGRKLAHFRPTLIHDPGSMLRRPDFDQSLSRCQHSPHPNFREGGARVGLARAEFERVLVVVTFRFCSVVQPIPVSDGARFSKRRQRPGEPCRNPNVRGSTGQRFSLQSQNWVVQPMIVVRGRRPRKLPTSGIGWPVGPRNARRGRMVPQGDALVDAHMS